MNLKHRSTQLSIGKGLLLFACYSFGSFAIGLSLGRAILLPLCPGSASLPAIIIISIAFLGGMLLCWKSLPENRPDPKGIVIRIAMLSALIVCGSILHMHRLRVSDMNFPEGLLSVAGLIIFILGSFVGRQNHKPRRTVREENAG
jgi:hypothetical protein